MSLEVRKMEGALAALLQNYPDPALHQWVMQTIHAFRDRLEHIVDPEERIQAQKAALILIKETLRQWSENPPVRH